jgi:hypothetical protein
VEVVIVQVHVAQVFCRYQCCEYGKQLQGLYPASDLHCFEGQKLSNHSTAPIRQRWQRPSAQLGSKHTVNTAELHSRELCLKKGETALTSG